MSLDLRKMRRQRFRGSHVRSFTRAEWEDHATLSRFFDGMQFAIAPELLGDVLAEHDQFNDRFTVRWRTR